jgi:hypothetical protein
MGSELAFVVLFPQRNVWDGGSKSNSSRRSAVTFAESRTVFYYSSASCVRNSSILEAELRFKSCDVDESERSIDSIALIASSENFSTETPTPRVITIQCDITRFSYVYPIVIAMNRAQFRLCLAITRELREHPAGYCFHRINDPSLSEPVDLDTVETRLTNREYRSVRQWKQDIKLIWENTIASCGSRSAPADCARHCDALFERRLRRLSELGTAGWLNRVSELKVKFDRLTAAPPANVRENYPLDLLAPERLDPFTPDDYAFVFAGLTGLPKEPDRVRLKKLLKRPKSVLDLTNLPLRLLHSAKHFVDSQTPKQAPAPTGMLGSQPRGMMPV